MRNARMKWAAVLALVLLSMVVVLSVAASPPHKEMYRVNTHDVNVNWFEWLEDHNFLDNDICPHIPEGLTIFNDELTNDRNKHGRVTNLAGGAKRVEVDDFVKGTATDDLGRRYMWFYRNRLSIYFDGEIAHAEMWDTWEVRGKEFSQEAGFSWAWEYEADDVTIIEEYQDGHLFNFYPDFIWPTDDGETQSGDPNLVPDSWEQFFTYGDPLLCDPI